MWILTAMAVVAMQLLPGSKPSRAVFSPSAPLMYCHSTTGQPKDLVWDFFLWASLPQNLFCSFIAQRRSFDTKKCCFWEICFTFILLQSATAYVNMKTISVFNAMPPSSPHTCTESKHSSRSKNTPSLNVQQSPSTSFANLVSNIDASNVGAMVTRTG